MSPIALHYVAYCAAICHISLQYVILRCNISRIAAICHIAVDMLHSLTICHVAADLLHSAAQYVILQ